MPPADMMGMPGMCNEMRRPMMLLAAVELTAQFIKLPALNCLKSVEL